jgi:transposase, IS5 family
MRQLLQEQPTLNGPIVDHRVARELEAIDGILRENPRIPALVLQDLRGTIGRSGAGREGMPAEQVLRAAILKQRNLWTYDEISFHLADSQTYRAFCGLGPFDPSPKRSTLQRNIKSLTESTWEQINRSLMRYARELRIENGRKIRTDATPVESNIHAPSDSSLLWDAVRVLNRLLLRAHENFGIRRFPNRTRRAKRRALEIQTAKPNQKRKRVKAYRDLLHVTRETMGYAREAMDRLGTCPEILAPALAAEIGHYVKLTERVVDQTERRVLHGEEVPAEEKIFSLFEAHTDIIIKDRRDIFYGHKLTVTGGRSGLILDWVIEDGNPADSTLAVRMIERQQEIYGRVPRQVAFDGGYASKDNLREIKELGVKDVSFSKKRGLDVLDMVKSHWVYRSLRNFRAGIESWISFLKRSFGLERAYWRGQEGFARYVGASIVAANLVTLARHLT